MSNGDTTYPGSQDATTAWHALDSDTATERLGSSGSGLDEHAVAASRARHGRNELTETGAKRPLVILWEQFTATLVLILLAAAGLSVFLGKMLEAAAILAIVALFALLGFFQEYRAERAIAALREMSTPRVRVRRASRTVEIPAGDVVVGDVVLLDAGAVVPADLRLLEAAGLRIQEAALTGESEPVDKSTGRLADADVPLGDRVNMAYMGTAVTYGRGIGLVVATGMGTELGKVANLLQSVAQEATPLQRKLDRVGRALAVFGVGAAVAVGAIGLWGGDSLDDVVLTSVSTMVAVVPEGLPAVVTLTLALGSQRMLRRNALIRRLPAVETLGSVTVICTDKTGTLTENRMTVTTVDVAGRRLTLDELVDGREVLVGEQPGAAPVAPALRLTLLSGALCNDATVEVRPEDGALVTMGDPTEAALVAAALRAGVDLEAARDRFPRLAEIPFDSDRKRMATVHAMPEPEWSGLDSAAVAFVKGSVDGLIEVANRVWVDGSVEPMDPGWSARIQAANDDLAGSGMRVIGVAMRELPGPEALPEAETNLIFLGMVGIIDPPRPEVAAAVQRCLDAGIRPVMITGDHPVTAMAIARDLGIPSDSAVSGAAVESMDGSSLVDVVGSASVFARVSPEHKLRIVEALSARGQIVAMTGDGVNDAPALRQADIGVAMGISGTDVSKEAADMVLRDDNFSTIVAAVEEGRVIYDNLRRFVSFAVAGNIGKVLVMLAWPVALLVADRSLEGAVALLPLQLLWLNLMTDGLLGLSLGAEPAEPDVMRRKPVDPRSGIFGHGLGAHTVVSGFLIGALTLGIGIWYFHHGPAGSWQPMMFTTLAMLQVFQALAVRSHVTSVTSIPPFRNGALNAAVLVVLALQAAAIYLPGLSDTVLELHPLGPGDWGVAIAAGAVFVVLIELRKRLLSPRIEGGKPMEPRRARKNGSARNSG